MRALGAFVERYKIEVYLVERSEKCRFAFDARRRRFCISRRRNKGRCSIGLYIRTAFKKLSSGLFDVAERVDDDPFPLFEEHGIHPVAD